MTNQEAVARIKDHKSIHKMDEPRAIYISEALDMAIKALEKQKTGLWIMNPKGMYAHLVCNKCLSNAPYDYPTNYCPNCGANMKGEQK